MSGGSHNYLYKRVYEWPLSSELQILLVEVFKSVEWAESCDTRREDAEKCVYDRVLHYMNKVVEDG